MPIIDYLERNARDFGNDVALVEFRHFMSDLAVGFLDFWMEEADGNAFVLRIFFAEDFPFAAAEDG